MFVKRPVSPPRLLFTITLSLSMFNATVAHPSAQTPKTVWDTHEELLSWLAFPVVERRVQALNEGGVTFLRLTKGDFDTLSQFPVFLQPPSDDVAPIEARENLPVVVDPSVHNALRLRVRQTIGLTNLRGFWLHRSGDYDESFRTVPFFEPVELQNDGSWEEITLPMTDSRFFATDDDVTNVTLGFFGDEVWKTSRENSARFDTAPADAFFDIDRIEILAVAAEPSTNVTITDVQPRKGPRGTIVTITGAGFAVPAEDNVVLFNVAEAPIVDGTEAVLRVKAVSTGSAEITVRRRGAAKAVADVTFEVILPASKAILVDGDGQTINTGSTSAPLTVKVRNRSGEGVPGQTVLFRVSSGDGTMSVEEVVTDNDGLASSQLVAGNVTGTVTVEARSGRLLPVVFTAIVN